MRLVERGVYARMLAAVVEVLKKRFNNLTAMELITLAAEILEATDNVEGQA